MSKMIEVETRTMISKQQYFEMCSFYMMHDSYRPFVENNNIYFDYDDFSLTDAHQMIRLRIIDDKLYELTLKIKGDEGDLEITQPLKQHTALSLLENNVFPDGEIKNELLIRNISISSLNKKASILTRRLSIEKEDYKIEIDYNRYDDVEDYDFEIETTNTMAFCREKLAEIAKKFNIEITKNYIVKSARAINSVR